MGKKTVAFIFHMNLYPAMHGSQARVVELIKGVKSFGYNTVLIVNQNFFGENPKGNKLKKVISEMKKIANVVVPLDEPIFNGDVLGFDYKPYADALEKVKKRYNPVAVVAEYIWMAPCLEHAGKAVKFVDTHDLMHVRKAYYGKRGIDPWIYISRKQEAGLLNKADVVISIQKNEQKKFKSMVPKKKVIHLPHFPSNVQKLKKKKVEDYIMVIGSDNPSNVDGIKRFLKEAWPIVLKEIPDAKLNVYGKLADKVGKRKGVNKVGFVDDLNDAYSKARVVINPTVLGTGLKIKTVEALCQGKALVTTVEGGDGLEEGKGKAFISEKDFKKYAKSVIKLLKDDKARESLEKKAYSYAQKTFSKENVFKEFLREVKKRG